MSFFCHGSLHHLESHGSAAVIQVKELCAKDDVLCDKAQCFADFTYEKSQGKLMVLDVQGAGLNLYDPEIASAELTDGDGSLRLCNGNLAEGAIRNFFGKHKCNFYCKILQLKLLPSASQ